ncbi:hypothetical protein GE09DRAFT_463390 [Coniochaeta sp. 2T2.1]|nr:hypothetical protein GE09DRAFT_463390 [Coniochaeta sp. 2T2.1]
MTRTITNQTPHQQQPATAMCQYAIYRSPRCGCRWLAITHPCFPGGGFSTCETLQHESNGSGRMYPAVPAFTAERGSCPRHGLDGDYDYNLVRMVVRIRNGFHIGAGGDRTDPGVDVSWCRCM